MQNETKTVQQPKIIPLSKWNDYFDYPKVGALRQYVFRNTSNFKTEVIKILGKRQYIDVEAFTNWVNKQEAGVENV